MPLDGKHTEAVKVREMIRLIEDDGGALTRFTGSHRQYAHPTKPGKVTIPGRPSAELHPKDCGEHPSTGRLEAMRDFRKLARSYLILVEGGPPSNYSAWSPDVPGCAGAGDTVETCVEDMVEAIAFHLEGLAADGEPLPAPTASGVYVARPSRAA